MPGPDDAPASINLTNAQGDRIAATPQQAGWFVQQGYHVEGAEEGADLEAKARQHERNSGLYNEVASGLLGVARGATLGGSDVLARALGKGEDVRELREEHPTISAATGLLGAALPAALSGGDSLAGTLGDLTPSGALSNIGRSIAETGEGASVLGRAGATAAAGAVEGAAQNAGAYISDVALGDRKLSADGFVGAMGQGALWGGVGGGALSLSADGLAAARRLFPKAEITQEATRAATSAAEQEMGSAVSDSQALQQSADDALKAMRDVEEIKNPTFKAENDAIRLEAARQIAESKVRIQAMNEEFAAKKLADKAANAKKVPVKKILDDLGGYDQQFAEEEAARQAAKAPLVDQAISKGVGAGAKSAVKGAVEGGDEDDSLLARQLKGTKAALDQGKSLAQVAAERPGSLASVDALTDALNANTARTVSAAQPIAEKLNAVKASSQELDGWLGKYGKENAVAKFERSQAARDTVAPWRSGTPQWVTDVPEGEGNMLKPRGMEKRFTGTEAEKDQWIADWEKRNVTSEKYSQMQSHLDDMALRKMGRKGIPDINVPPSGDEIVAASAPQDVASAKLGKMLGAPSKDINAEIAEAAPIITRHEAAHADLTEELGQAAPPTSQYRARMLRQAQQTAEDKTAANTTQLGSEIAKASPFSAGKQLLTKAGDAATAYEALRQLGVPLPDPKNIPVVGPLLSMYLKAKVAQKVLGRRGGQVLMTAEGTIASKAAMIRQRVYKVADAMLAGASAGARVAAPRAGGAIAALGHTLFSSASGSDKPQPYDSAPKKGSPGDLYLQRSAEVNAAMVPGAIDEAMRKRIQTSDPEILQEAIATQMRKLQYLAQEMPRPGAPPSPLDQRPWLPSKVDLDRWGECVRAVEDPAGTLERAAIGQASSKELEAVQKVYPALWADAQKRVVLQLADGKGQDLTTAQRSAVSRTFGLPLDAASRPDVAAFLQAGYQAPPPQRPPPTQGSPVISGPLNLGQRTMTPLDQG